ncbi:MAG: hypothetical protein NT031_14585 [Planctomycetota bacterium]|nr:hypothetical protein [Planctomycetota bacterium]
MDFKHDTQPRGEATQPDPAPLDQATLYRRAMITKIRLRQAIFRARHLATNPPGAHRTAV